MYIDDLYNRKDELEEIIDKMDTLIDDITDVDYKDTFKEIKYDAESELEEVDEQIGKLEQKELEEENRQFERSRL